jgi:cell division protein FtsA
MNSVSDYIVAIDLGSSRIIGSLGEKNAGDKIKILAIEQIPVQTGVRRGVVHNIEDVSKNIMDLLDLLSKSQEKPFKIDQVLIGVNGYTIRTVDVSSTTYLSGEELVNERHLDELSDDAQSQVPDNLDVMDIFTQEFLVDGKMDIHPVGSMPQRVEGHYKIVGGKSSIMKSLEACFDRIHIRYETILGPVASAEAILRPEDKAKGAVAIDFGAETTSLCIYKGNIVRYIAVLPFGGNNITRDLLQLNIDEEEAEKFKLNKGTAIHYTEHKNEISEISETEKLSDLEKDEHDIAVARIEEIVENIWAQIRYSGIEPQKLTEGMILTGGASQLRDLTELLRKKTSMPVRIGDPGQSILSQHSELFNKPEYAQCIGLLLLGKTGGCCTEPIISVQTESGTPKEQTLSGFDIEKQQEITAQKAPNTTTVPKKHKKTGFSIFKDLFNEEDL